MKTLLLSLVVAFAAAPSFAVTGTPAASAKMSDLTSDDFQFLSTNLFMNADDDLIKGLSAKQKDDVHKLIVSKKLDQTAKIDQVGQYLTNIWAENLDKKMKSSKTA